MTKFVKPLSLTLAYLLFLHLNFSYPFASNSFENAVSKEVKSRINLPSGDEKTIPGDQPIFTQIFKELKFDLPGLTKPNGWITIRGIFTDNNEISFRTIDVESGIQVWEGKINLEEDSIILPETEYNGEISNLVSRAKEKYEEEYYFGFSGNALVSAGMGLLWALGALGCFGITFIVVSIIWDNNPMSTVGLMLYLVGMVGTLSMGIRAMIYFAIALLDLLIPKVRRKPIQEKIENNPQEDSEDEKTKERLKNISFKWKVSLQGEAGV